MKPSTLTQPGLHLAIIPDGNGRWARARGRVRTEGHRVGMDSVRRVVEAAPSLGVGTLTFYGFSAYNWERPPDEVRNILRILHEYLANELQTCVEYGVRLSFLGRRDRLPAPLRELMAIAEHTTIEGRALHLRLAFDYSSREAILRAATRLYSATELTTEAFSRLLAGTTHAGPPAPDVDLLIRTGGDKRLSDFLLWECAFAELYFTDVAWPDFTAEHLAAALDEFHSRERRFGALPQAAAV